MAQAQTVSRVGSNRVFLDVRVELDDHILHLIDDKKKLEELRKELKKWEKRLYYVLRPSTDSTVSRLLIDLDTQLQLYINSYEEKIRTAILNRIVAATKKRIAGDGQ